MTLPPVSSRTEIQPFVVMDVMARAAAEEARGRDIIHMEVGEPGFAAPEAVRTAAEVALNGEAIQYSLALGREDLRQEIAAHYRRKHDLVIAPERVVVTAGSSAAFILSFQAAFEAGDRLGTANPSYPAYRNTAASLGVKTVTVDVGPEHGWVPQPAQIQALHQAHALKGFLLASPANPTGSMVTPEALKALVAQAEALGIWFISDEIYHGLTYDFAGETALKYSDDVIVINSFSKTYCMTGWRLGWMIVPDRLVRPIERLAQNFFICPSHLAQIGAIKAFGCEAELDLMVQAYHRNRDLLISTFREVGLNRLAPSHGAFYIYADITDFSQDSLAFTSEMLQVTGIAATPGNDFDPARGHRFVRFSYAQSEQRMIEAAKRLKDWLGQR